jgi:hypothetical protein
VRPPRRAARRRAGALGLLLHARRLGALVRALGTLPAAHELQRAARRDTGEHFETGRRQLGGESAVL